MPLIVDANNLLHATMPPSLAGLEEAGLCRLLASSVWRGQRMVVVCDGAPGPLRLIASPVPQVELMFAGHKCEADDVILELIEQETAPRRLVVVSSDHVIRKAAHRRRARDVSSDQFVQMLARIRSHPATSAQPGVEGDRPPLGSAEVEYWLRELGLDGEA
jgi:uncharacterized protein